MRRSTFAALVYALFAIIPAQAQDHHRWHQYYKKWLQPGTTVSCCDARIIQGGKDMIGDCEPARFEIRNGQWFAWLRQESRWIEVPDSKIIRERNPSSEEGHLCARKWDTGWVILCAVPPDTGG